MIAVRAYDPPLRFDSNGHEIDVGTGGPDELPAVLVGRHAYVADGGKVRQVSVETGDTAWQIRSRWAGHALGDATAPPQVVTVGDKKVVLAVFAGRIKGSGTKKGHTEAQLLAVDAMHGKRLWATSFRVPLGGYPSLAWNPPALVGANTRVAVVSYGNRTYVVDMRRHRLLWSDPHRAAEAFDRGLIVMQRRASETEPLLGVRARNHRTVWRALPSLFDRNAQFAGPGLTAVASTSVTTFRGPFVLLRTRTGEVVSREHSVPELTCRYDGRSVTVCSGYHLVLAYDTSSGKRLWRLPDKKADRVAPRVSAVWHDVVYGEGIGGEVLLRARTGKERRGHPGIVPIQVSGYGALANVDGSYRLCKATG